MKTVIVLSFLAAASSHALTPSDCKRQGEVFGSSLYRTIASIDAGCAELAAKNSRLRAVSYDGELEVAAFENILFITRGEGKELAQSKIAGAMSQLKNIKAVALSPDKKLIAVLNEYVDEQGGASQEILFFKANRSGDVAPLYVNQSPLLKDGTKLAFSSDSKYIEFLSSREGGARILSFQADRDSRSPLAGKRPEARALQIDETEIVDLLRVDELYIFLHADGKISGNTVVDGKISVAWQLSKKDVALPSYTELAFDHNKGVMAVKSAKGDVAEFEL